MTALVSMWCSTYSGRQLPGPQVDAELLQDLFNMVLDTKAYENNFPIAGYLKELTEDSCNVNERFLQKLIPFVVLRSNSTPVGRLTVRDAQQVRLDLPSPVHPLNTGRQGM